MSLTIRIACDTPGCRAHLVWRTGVAFRTEASGFVQLARDDGWQLATCDGQPLHYCPQHRLDPVMRPRRRT